MTQFAPIVLDASLPAGGPRQIARTLAPYRPADAAEALNGLDRKLAARVLQVMPKDAAVQIMNEPHLEQPAELTGLMPVDSAASILIDLNPDRRADVFGELPEGLRAALSPRLDASARAVLERLLSYPAHSAGGLMTTDFVSVPIDWTVAQT